MTITIVPVWCLRVENPRIKLSQEFGIVLLGRCPGLICYECEMLCWYETIRWPAGGRTELARAATLRLSGGILVLTLTPTRRAENGGEATDCFRFQTSNIQQENSPAMVIITH